MTKKEKIKESWGEHYEIFKDYITENGWVDFKKAYGDRGLMLSFKDIPLEVMNNYNPKYCYWKRPVTLSGIEDNNGWVKIESIDSFPENGILCITGILIDEKFHYGTLRYRTKLDFIHMWQNAELTHYISFDSKPIY